MMKLNIIVIATFLAILSSLAASEKPNILFLFADDYAFDALGACGNDEVKTPHLDRLAERSTQFTHAYNSGAWGGAVCVASRTMMMTGMQVWNARNASHETLLGNKQYFPQLVASAGYDTYFAGKWHVGSNANCELAWKNTVNIRKGMPNQTSTRMKREFLEGEPDTWSPTDPQYEGFWKGGKHWSEVLADDGEFLLEKAAKNEKPFMMMLCFNAPHDPRQAPKEYQDMYPYEDIAVPDSFQSEYPYDIGSNKIRDEKLAPFPRTPYSIKVNRSEYYALITHMDAQIGRILDALDATGKADNTVIIFSADHGLAVGHHGLLGKQNMYDHSVRVPWFISGPGVPKGKKVSSPIYLQDAMATCLDLAGAEKPGHIEFNSVLPLIETPLERDIYSSYIHFQRMVVHGDYKYIAYPLIGQHRLYNLKKDPKEIKDLSADSTYSKTLQKCRDALRKEMKKFSDPLDLDDPKLIKSGKSLKKRKKSR